MVRLLSSCLMRFGSGPVIKQRVTRSTWLSKGSEYLFEGKDDVKVYKAVETGAPIAKNKLRIRLAKSGATNRPYYRIVLAHKLHNGHVELEQLGTYDPYPNINNEKICSLNFERIKHHVALGAFPVRPVRRLLGLSGFLPLDPTLLIRAENLKRLRTIETLLEEKKAKEEAEEEE